MIYYCTYTMGGTSRGVGVLKALGEGVLVTPYYRIARREELPWFGHVPHPLAEDVLIYDRITDYRDKGRRVAIGPGGDVDLVVDWPITSHEPADLDAEKAEQWWTAPVIANGDLTFSVLADPPEVKRLACRGGRTRTVRDFRASIKAPEVRVVTNHPREFYWPAIELMALADEVIGERQVQNEWAVARGDADPDGAKRAAAEIRKLLRG